MVKYVYNDILKKNVKQSTIKMGMSYVYMFQQENNSKHTAEFKPIEHLWAILKRGVHKVSIKSKYHLKRVVIRKWEAISLEICRNLVNSMHRRCVAGLCNQILKFEMSDVNMLFLSNLKSSVRTEMLRKIDMFWL